MTTPKPVSLLDEIVGDCLIFDLGSKQADTRISLGRNQDGWYGVLFENALLWSSFYATAADTHTQVHVCLAQDAEDFYSVVNRMMLSLPGEFQFVSPAVYLGPRIGQTDSVSQPGLVIAVSGKTRCTKILVRSADGSLYQIGLVQRIHMQLDANLADRAPIVELTLYAPTQGPAMDDCKHAMELLASVPWVRVIPLQVPIAAPGARLDA